MGGVGRYAYRLATELRERVDLTVVTLEGGRSLDGVHMEYVPRRHTRFERYYRTPLGLRSTLERLAPDLIHSFGDDWGIRRGVAPRVRTFHGSARREAWASTGARRANHLVLAALEHRSAGLSDARVAIAPDTMETFRCQFLMPPVVPVAIDAHRTPSADPTITFIGSFRGRKRGWLAQHSVEDARRSSGRQVGLHVIGPAADAGNWAPWVTHHAGLGDRDVLRVVADSWLLVAPSEYEGFGIPVYEALSLGVPALASSTPGSEFISSLVGPSRSLTLSSDAELSGRIHEAVTRGPELSTSEQVASARAVQEMLRLGSPRRLVEEIYPSVLRGDARGAHRPRRARRGSP